VVAELFLLRELSPVVLHVLRLVAPVTAYNFRNFWVGQVWVSGNNLGVVMLAIQDEG
jgi:hypothetical protein